jgi:hypothetical protein
VPGTVVEVGPGACEVRISAESASLLLQYVAGIIALGTDFTVDAAGETAELIRSVGQRLAQTLEAQGRKRCARPSGPGVRVYGAARGGSGWG